MLVYYFAVLWALGWASFFHSWVVDNYLPKPLGYLFLIGAMALGALFVFNFPGVI